MNLGFINVQSNNYKLFTSLKEKKKRKKKECEDIPTENQANEQVSLRLRSGGLHPAVDGPSLVGMQVGR